MKVLFSCPLELGRVGAGRPYGHLADWLERGQHNHEATIVRGSEIVKTFYPEGIPPGPESLGQAVLADIVASVENIDGADYDVFLGTGCASLDQIRAIRSQKPKVPIVTTWFSSHYRYAYETLEREYRLVGLKEAVPIDPFLVWRDMAEHKMSDALVVPSQACADTYEADAACRGKTRVAGFGVDSEVFHPNPDLQNDFRVLYAGGNWVRKGLHYLISAWGHLKLPGVLTVLGTNATWKDSWKTVYPNWVPDDQVPAYFRSNSVFCLPTLEEGEALVVLEAMASGCACIVTKESGAPIEDGVDGLIVPQRDAKALAAALKRLYDHPKEREDFGAKAREKALHLTWKRFAKEVVRILEVAAG